MSDRRAAALRMGAWMVVLAAALVVLTAGGPAAPPSAPRRWGDWVRVTPPAEAAFALVRMAALAAGWYLAAVTVLGLGARVLRAPRLAEATGRLTLPPVRRVLAQVGVVTVGLAGGVAPLAGTTVAAATQSPVSTTPDVPAGESTLTMTWLPPPAETPSSSVATPAPPPPVPEPPSWTVGPGECFWSIADQVLTGAWGRQPADREVAPYWERLIEANRSALADPSNPDLVYPGQTFTVPAP